MAFNTGLLTDISDSVTIADPEVLVLAKAIQLPMSVGTFWNDCMIQRIQKSNPKFDIFSRSISSNSGTVGTGGWDDSATTALPVTSSVGLVSGHILDVAGEYVIVNAITSATVITVKARGACGTTAAAHLATVAYTVVGFASKDEDVKNIDSVSESTLEYTNYMQLIVEAIDFTRANQTDVRLGLRDGLMGVAREEAFLRVVKNLVVSSILGKKQNTTSSATPFTTAGLLQQLTDTTSSRVVLTDAIGGAFTEAQLIGSLETVTDKGTPNTIYMSRANKNIVNTFNNAATSTTLVLNKDATSTTAGVSVNKYVYEGKEFDIKVDSNMPDSDVAIVNINDCYKGWKIGDELRLVKEPDISSREYRETIQGMYFIEIENVGYEHIVMTGITT